MGKRKLASMIVLALVLMAAWFGPMQGVEVVSVLLRLYVWASLVVSVIGIAIIIGAASVRGDPHLYERVGLGLPWYVEVTAALFVLYALVSAGWFFTALAYVTQALCGAFASQLPDYTRPKVVGTVLE